MTPGPSSPVGLAQAPSFDRNRLKRATASVHQSLEDALDLVGAGLTLARYQRVLSAFLGFYEPVERRLDALAAAAPPLPPVRRAPLLRRDLGALGLSAADLAALPRCQDVPALVRTEHLAGCLYVLEGASLGGQLIARSLQTRLGLDEHKGASFFVGAGPGTRARWADVLAWLEALAAAGAQAEEVERAAIDTFASLERWIRAQGAGA